MYDIGNKVIGNKVFIQFYLVRIILQKYRYEVNVPLFKLIVLIALVMNILHVSYKSSSNAQNFRLVVKLFASLGYK